MSAIHDARQTGGVERALDASYYTDTDMFERERARIFHRTWQYAGHVSELEKPLATISPSRSAARTCSRSVTARARCATFHNVCMHRAHELLRGQGSTRLIACPYHAWTYELDGRLRRAPNQSKVDGFDASKICLTEVRTELFCGFIFVNLDPQAAPMADWFPNVEQELQQLRAPDRRAETHQGSTRSRSAATGRSRSRTIRNATTARSATRHSSRAWSTPRPTTSCRRAIASDTPRSPPISTG